MPALPAILPSAEPEKARLISRIGSTVDARLREISAASLNGRAKLRRQKVRSFLTLHQAKFWAAGQALGFHDLHAVAELAQEIDCFAPDGREPVMWYRRDKGAGRGWRPVCVLGPRRKAESYLVKMVLEAQFVAPGFMFGIRRKGRDDEALGIASAIADGYAWCVTADIADCFQSVSEEALHTLLPLPSSVVSNCLDCTKIEFHEYPKGNDQLGRRDGPNGLMQGSPTSNAALAWLLRDFNSALEALDCRPFLIFDNLFLASRDEATARTSDTLIQQYFEGHRAGPFHLHSRHISHARDAVEHVGYQFTWQPGQARIEPSERGYEKIYRRLADAYDQASAASNYEPLERALAQSLSGYQAWGAKEDFVEEVRYLYPEFYAAEV